MGIYDADLRIFPDELVPEVQASDAYKRWARTSPGDRGRWEVFRDALLAGNTPAVPVMSTRFGRGLIAAGKEHMSITRLVGQMTTGYPPGPPAPPSGTLIYHAPMEAANVLPACPPEYDSMASPNNGSVTWQAGPFMNTGQVAIVPAENGVTPRRGSKMMRMEVRPNECAAWDQSSSPPGSIQAALVQKQPGSLPGVGLGYDNYQAISFYVYPGLEVLNPNMHCVLLEWHGTGQMQQAPFHFGINALNGQWYCDLHRVASGYFPVFTESMGAHQAGVWMNVVSGIRWRSDNTGFYKLWLKPSGTGPMTDADLKVNRTPENGTGLATWNTAGAIIYPAVTVYRWPFSTLGRVYFDSHRIGDTLAVVDPENYL